VIIQAGERLVLREFSENDWEALHAYSADERLCLFLNWGPNSEEDSKQFIRHAVELQKQEPRTAFELAIAMRESGEMVGNCSIRITHAHHREGELHVIVRRADWGKGYGSEGIAALLDFGFGELYLHRIYSIVDPEDVATARVLEKNGLKREGHFREHKWIKEDWRDSLYYAVLDYEWEKLREHKKNTAAAES